MEKGAAGDAALAAVEGAAAAEVGAAGDQRRRLVVTRGAEAGALLLRAAPAAAVLLPELWGSHCHVCFRSGVSLSRCARCQTAYYCSRACQTKDWKPDHQAECKRLKQLAGLNLHADQMSDVLMLGRVVRRRAAEAGGKDGDTSPKVSSLVWYEEDVASQENQLLAALAVKLGFVSDGVPMVELQRMLSRFQNNNFSVCDELMLEVGAGCYPLGAMINHSCAPNCAVTYSPETHELEVRAIRSIDAGEEILQTYVDIALPRAQRQQRLQMKYHFQCSCFRCTEPSDNTSSLDAFLDCDSVGVPKAQWSLARQQELHVATETFKASTPGQRIPALKKLLGVQREALHPLNISLLQTYSALFSAEMERGNVRPALEYGEHMLEFYRRVYPSNHPMVGLHLFTLGDLLSQSEGAGSSRKSREYFKEARNVLTITHGSRHHLVSLLDDRLR